MKMGHENFSMRVKMQTLSDGAVVSDARVEVRRRNQGRVISAMLVLLTIVTASTWLGCNGGPPPPLPPADPSQCSNGIAVPDPLENSGLVEDCETLLRVRDRLAAGVWLYWNDQKSILDWEGVSVGAEGRSLRVTGLICNTETGPERYRPSWVDSPSL